MSSTPIVVPVSGPIGKIVVCVNGPPVIRSDRVTAKKTNNKDDKQIKFKENSNRTL